MDSDFETLQETLLKSQNQEAVSFVTTSGNRIESIVQESTEKLQSWKSITQDSMSRDFSAFSSSLQGLNDSICSFDAILSGHVENQVILVNVSTIYLTFEI